MSTDTDSSPPTLIVDGLVRWVLIAFDYSIGVKNAVFFHQGMLDECPTADYGERSGRRAAGPVGNGFSAGISASVGRTRCGVMSQPSPGPAVGGTQHSLWLVSSRPSSQRPAP